MNLEQLCRLRAMADSVLSPGRGVASWDLNREDANAIRAAIDAMPNPRLVEALQAVLLFHSAGPWDSDKRLEWWNLTDRHDATTKGLCDFIRDRLNGPFDSGAYGPNADHQVRTAGNVL